MLVPHPALLLAAIANVLTGCQQSASAPFEREPVAVTALPGTTGQSAAVGEPVAIAPAVRVTDAAHRPVPGVTVLFVVISGGGSIMPASSVTDQRGVATAGAWVLGTVAAIPQRVRATVGGLESVEFSAAAVPGPPVAFSVSPDTGIVVVGSTLQMNASLRDKFGNLTGPAASFSSSNQSIATVTSGGVVTGLDIGFPVITVTADTFSRAVPLTALRRLSGLTGRPFGVRQVSGSIAYVTRQDTWNVTRIDATLGSLGTTTTTGSRPSDIVFNSARTLGYVSNVGSGTVSVFDAVTGDSVRNISVSENPLRVAISPNDSIVYVPDNDGAIAVIRTWNDSVTFRILGPGPLNGIALTPDGATLYVASNAGKVYRLNASTMQVLGSSALLGRLQEVVLSDDLSELYLADEFGSVRALDATTLALKRSGTVPAPFGMQLSLDKQRLYVSAPARASVYILNAGTLRIERRIPVGAVPRRLTRTANGEILVANEGGWVDVLP